MPNVESSGSTCAVDENDFLVDKCCHWNKEFASGIPLNC